MSENYILHPLRPHELKAQFPFAERGILESEYRFCPNWETGALKAEKENCSSCVIVYSRFFNEAMTALLRGVRELDATATTDDLLDYVREEEKVFPESKNMSRSDVVDRMSSEYVFVGTTERSILAPVCLTINENHYVRYGLLHVLQRHYDRIHALGYEKARSIFPPDSTINEILGAVVKAVVEGEKRKSSDERLRLTTDVKIVTPDYEDTERYLLVADENESPKPHILVTFFPESG